MRRTVRTWSSVATAASAAALGLATKATAAPSACSQQETVRVIVDAGSGWSRIEALAIGDGGCVSTVEKRRLEARPLAEVLAQRQAHRLRPPSTSRKL